MKRKNSILNKNFLKRIFLLFKNKNLENTMRYAYKTINNNWLIPDRGAARFIDTFGNHLRWVTDQECEYLMKVLEIHEPNEAPAARSNPHFPKEEVVWEHVKPPEDPGLSNNGGSYYNLTRVIHRAGFSKLDDGYYLVFNHLYLSDFEHQGWIEEKISEDKVKLLTAK